MKRDEGAPGPGTSIGSRADIQHVLLSGCADSPADSPAGGRHAAVSSSDLEFWHFFGWQDGKEHESGGIVCALRKGVHDRAGAISACWAALRVSGGGRDALGSTLRMGIGL